jgi:hypothetical protein
MARRYDVKGYLLLFGVATVGVLVLAACGGGGDGAQTTPAAINPADFQTTIDNPWYPLSSLKSRIYEGQEPDPDTGEMVKTRLESTVLPQTDVVAGVEVTVLEEKNYEDGELVEDTLDYFAQHKDGSVYYFGERVDDYEGGQVVGHESQWLAGEGDNQPGVFMPAQPSVGMTFEQEKAPGIAEDQSKVVATDQTVTTPAGTFSGCIKTEDFSPLDNVTEHKYYCPGDGFVREEPESGFLELVSR